MEQNIEIVNTAIVKPNRFDKYPNGHPGWKKGVSGNPAGRPKNAVMDELRAALKKVEAEKGISFLEHFVRRSYVCKEIAVALAKKILPDQIQTELQGEGARIIIIRPMDNAPVVKETSCQQESTPTT